jgi:hypothetical protein
MLNKAFKKQFQGLINKESKLFQEDFIKLQQIILLLLLIDQYQKSRTEIKIFRLNSHNKNTH